MLSSQTFLQFIVIVGYERVKTDQLLSIEGFDEIPWISFFFLTVFYNLKDFTENNRSQMKTLKFFSQVSYANILGPYVFQFQPMFISISKLFLRYFSARLKNCRWFYSAQLQYYDDLYCMKRQTLSIKKISIFQEV